MFWFQLQCTSWLSVAFLLVMVVMSIPFKFLENLLVLQMTEDADRTFSLCVGVRQEHG